MKLETPNIQPMHGRACQLVYRTEERNRPAGGTGACQLVYRRGKK